MKIKRQDEYNEICDALEKKSEEIEQLDETYGDLMNKRSNLFSEIILENKLLRGNWKLHINAVPTIVLSADKLKKEDDFRSLIRIGRGLKNVGRMHIWPDEDFDIVLIGGIAYWKLEICLLFINDFDELFNFFKEQGIKIQYNIFDFRMDAMKRQIAFLEKLEE